MIFDQGGVGSSETFHRLLVRSRKTVIMTWLCFNIFTSNLVKMAMQEGACGDVVEDVGGLRFGRKFV